MKEQVSSRWPECLEVSKGAVEKALQEKDERNVPLLF